MFSSEVKSCFRRWAPTSPGDRVVRYNTVWQVPIQLLAQVHYAVLFGYMLEHYRFERLEGGRCLLATTWTRRNHALIVLEDVNGKTVQRTFDVYPKVRFWDAIRIAWLLLRSRGAR